MNDSIRNLLRQAGQAAAENANCLPVSVDVSEHGEMPGCLSAIVELSTGHLLGAFLKDSEPLTQARRDKIEGVLLTCVAVVCGVSCPRPERKGLADAN